MNKLYKLLSEALKENSAAGLASYESLPKRVGVTRPAGNAVKPAVSSVKTTFKRRAKHLVK